MIRRMNLLLLTVFCILTQAVFAQPSDRMVQGTTGDLYLLHTVEPKENWYSIGRIYNISPRELAPYNHVSLESPLSIGQHLKIPLRDVNFTQSGGRESDEVYVPLYHTVKEREWMYRISVNYNKVPIESLEAWNQINRDEVQAGMKLIVGYLKVNATQSSLASLGTTVMKRGAVPASSGKAPASAGAGEDAMARPSATAKETPVRAGAEPRQEPPVAASRQDSPSARPASENRMPARNRESGESYFAAQYASSGKRLAGTSGVFKSTSGWEDKKYYALVNDVPVGTIIMISTASGERSVYAKVLGSLADMKDNAGLIARISDAAASELGAESASKINVEIRY